MKVSSERSAGPTNTVKVFSNTELSGAVNEMVTVLFPKFRSLSPSTSATQPSNGAVGVTTTASTVPGTVITLPATAGTGSVKPSHSTSMPITPIVMM